MLVIWKDAPQEKKTFYLSERLAINLNNYVDGVMTKNTSAVFIIDGRSGLGKTTLSTQIGCYINNKTKEYLKDNNPPFTLENNICFTPSDFVNRLKVARKGDIIILDEAMMISSRSAMTELNRNVIYMMSLIRSKNIFVIFNVNSIFDLDKNLPLHRADMLISLYPRDGKFGARGCYMVVPSTGGKLKKVYISGKKYYDYSLAFKIKAFNDTFTSFFPFKDNEYETRKQEAIQIYLESGSQKEDSITKRARDNYIKWILHNHPGMTKDEVARIGQISARTIYRSLKEEEKVLS